MSSKRKISPVENTNEKKIPKNTQSFESYLEFKDGTSNKFYKVKVNTTDNSVIATYGRIGADGVNILKEFDNYDSAEEYAEGLVREKLKKGYKKVNNLHPSTESSSNVKVLTVPPKHVIQTTSTSSNVNTTYLECKEGTSDKFYEISQNGLNVTTTYGRRGTTGLASMQTFDSQSKADAFVAKTLREKRNKGYNDAINGSSPNIIVKVAVVKSKAKAKTKQSDDNSETFESDNEDEDNNANGILYYLEFVEGSSDKFYQILHNNKSVTITYGRRSTSGTASITEYKSAKEATTAVNKLLREKRNKGYKDSTNNNTTSTATSTTKNNSLKTIVSKAKDIVKKVKVQQTVTVKSINKSKSYLLYLEPNEDSYNSKTKLLDYKIHLIELKEPINNQPCSVIEWFHYLYSSKNPTEFEKTSLNLEDGVDNLQSTYGDQDDSSDSEDGSGDESDEGIPPKLIDIYTWNQLTSFLKENLAVERFVKTTDNAIIFGQTREFDIEGAFFHANALNNNELTPLLTQFVELQANNTVILKTDQYRCTGYLDPNDNQANTNNDNDNDNDNEDDGEAEEEEETEQIIVERTINNVTYFIVKKDNLRIFYELTKDGLNILIRCGLCGAIGTETVKSFKSEQEVIQFIDLTTNEKLKEGYQLTNAPIIMLELI